MPDAGGRVVGAPAGPIEGRADWGRLLRFGLSGVLNTALGWGVIVAMLASGSGDIQANLAGYAAGLCLSFVLNARWTFADRPARRSGVALRFAATVLAAYGANLAVVVFARSIGFVDNPFAHLAGMAAYSCLFYLGAARFVFVAPARS